MPSFLTSDLFLKLVSLVFIPAAVAVKALTPDNTIAHKVADYVLGLGASVGVYSSSSRIVQGKVQGM